ncbi:hypothetical protein ONS95_006047 [Cadophora gregata]|uniref:uncharacterized protein n=1 Tax=Cadophora gregata TaxID=51156 RepID=UPI0026DAF1C5|nr:uncharacterized protein ONS95_006047 [Cadophora gregata]KAK0102427.1 hypothetical protein ONS95_006047 [Cadophora gregata]KAK0104053.1 hypothetical protein ONS96_005156 [Cadophora gregata f. sp. sojae]
MSTDPSSAITTPNDRYIDDHDNQVFLSSVPTLESTNSAGYQMTNTPKDDSQPYPSLPNHDEQVLDAVLAGEEISLDDSQPPTDRQYLETMMDEHNVVLGDFQWIIDEVHGPYFVDYALLVDIIDALKMINFERCTPEDAILLYAHGIEAIVNQIKIPGKYSIVTVNGEGGIMVNWHQLPALE